ncbi:transcriptional regulator [Amycolatopsis acidicola]|uniref:Transcriptional regulator n=1 Tax=Amycolatopsis acidicola TaxID=2596893 RepID=A0A5N0VAP1_9PSEU|nr:transcriptional regulator [Amycolatopsis acidicola]KAA9162598.1 transcriptional regulator [Amycolatopsis acidicola]
MNAVSGWTGETACRLQSALRMSNEAFAEHLGIGVRTVAGWHQKPTLRPKPEMQQLLDTALEQAPSPVKERFSAVSSPAPEDDRLADAHLRAALEWLDEHSDWPSGTARDEVSRRLVQVDTQQLRDRGNRRARVNQRQVADALRAYYSDLPEGYGCYSACIDDTVAATSILTHADWLDLRASLFTDDRFRLTSATPGPTARLDAEAASRAAQRLAESLALRTKLVNMPLYRLLGIDIADGKIDGTLGISHFVDYALTMDLLEGELVDSLVAGVPSTPLRDRYLPDAAAVLDLPNRLCAGGTLALCAFARPADPFRGPADYVLLVQERSGHVVNAARRLAVIPKGFHQPMADLRADGRIGATLRREMEEELFGRDDIDNTVAHQRAADPMHPSRLSEPMQWLFGEPGRIRMESTGFGLNLMSGNYEFPGLIVVEDEDFWARYGGLVEANWESANLRQYSSRDRALLTDLIGDVAWSNEGLFALLQGLRRLGEIGGDRVDLPAIEGEI